MSITLYQTCLCYDIVRTVFLQSSFDFPESGEARATFTNVIPRSVMTVEVVNGSHNLTVAYEQVSNTSNVQTACELIFCNRM